MEIPPRHLEIETFMHFAFGVWPQIRESHQRDLMRRCVICALPESFARIEASGSCEICADSAGSSDSGTPGGVADTDGMRLELDNLLKSSCGTPGCTYDAVILYSGGKDSMYLTHTLKTQYPGLRFLAVLVDNGFMSSVALANAHRGAALLGIDLVRLKPDPRLFEKTFRHAFLNLNEGGCYTTVDRMDGDLVFDIGRNFAASLRAPLMIAGLSVEQIQMIMGMQHFESPVEVESRARLVSAGFSLGDLYDASDCKRYWWAGADNPTLHVPRVIYPFYAWQPAEKDIVRYIRDKNLIKKGHDNPLVTNNDTIPVMLAVDYGRMGYSGFEPEFARMTRQGKSDVEAWLNLFQAIEFLSKRGEFLPNSIKETLGRLGLAEKDVGIHDLKADFNPIEAYV